jgi:hypothetical protein
MTCHCVANRVPVIRYSARAQNALFYAFLPSQKIRFNHPALSKVLLMMVVVMMTMMMMIIIIIIIITIKVIPVIIGETGLFQSHSENT